jgi:hypothetical protein
MTAQMLTMVYATISGVSFLHLRSSVTERMKPDGHQSGLAHYAVLDTRYDRAHRVEQTKT